MYGIYSNNDASRPESQVTVASGPSGVRLQRTSAVPTGLWTHLAATYDGTTERLYANGTQVAQLAVSGSITTSTARSDRRQHDLERMVQRAHRRGPHLQPRPHALRNHGGHEHGDRKPRRHAPGAPGTLTATGGLGQVSLGWGAATDNVGVVRYNVHRGTTAGFTPSTANRVAQPAGLSYTDSGLAAGTYYYRVTAEDAAGNIGPASNEASAAATADTTPPTVSITAPASGATVSATTTITASASDSGSVAGVQFKLDGANLGAEDTTAPYSFSWDTFASPNGPHGLTALARDGAGNTTTATTVPVTVQNTVSSGLVGAWAFDEASGTTAADQSGKGNNGTQTNATWIAGGKFNNALSFNGTNAWVTVPDSATLDLTTGMTVEAWVRPAAAGNWRTAVVKEQSGNLAYGIYANTDGNRPQAEVLVGGSTRSVVGTERSPDRKLEPPRRDLRRDDAAALRQRNSGRAAGRIGLDRDVESAACGSAATTMWGEWFSGTIDEVRIYNRALSAARDPSRHEPERDARHDPADRDVETPAPGAAGVNAGASATATFSEPMNAGTVTSSTFQLKDAAAALVPATVSYNATTNVATLTPQAALQYGATYTVTVKGGTGGVKDWPATRSPPT